MEFPKIVYDDFYKFLMSLGTILSVGSGIGIFALKNQTLNMWWSIIFVIIIIGSILIMGWAGKKWYKNQKHIDDKIEAESKIAIRDAQSLPLALKDQRDDITSSTTEKETKEESKVALVSCRITSVLPNSVTFNFSKDYKAWFLIANHGPQKYKAYVKLKYFADGKLLEDISNGHYGYQEAWNLNALSAIQAPGIIASEKIKAALNEKKRIKVIIDCKIHNENDELIEEKLPQTYVYDEENNSWFLEP
jgi:hypothetical protein